MVHFMGRIDKSVLLPIGNEIPTNWGANFENRKRIAFQSDEIGDHLKIVVSKYGKDWRQGF